MSPAWLMLAANVRWEKEPVPAPGGIEGNEGANGFTTWWLGDWMGERLSTGLGSRLGSGVRVKLLRCCFPGERWNEDHAERYAQLGVVRSLSVII